MDVKPEEIKRQAINFVKYVTIYEGLLRDFENRVCAEDFLKYEMKSLEKLYEEFSDGKQADL